MKKIVGVNRRTREIWVMDNEVEKAPYDWPVGAGQAIERAASVHLGSLRTPKVRSVITEQIKHLEAQVAERKKLLAQLDAQPAVEDLLDTMRRLGV